MSRLLVLFHQNTGVFVYYSDEEFVSVSTPERTLLAAVLERAIRDLLSNEGAAVAWFCDDAPIEKDEDPRFFFQDIAAYLNLSDWQIQMIFDFIKKGCYRDKCQAKGKAYRIGDFALASGERNKVSTSDTAVQRERGDFRCGSLGGVTRVAHRV